MKNTISVIVPVRNEENNISQVLQSLLNQSYSPYEIIVVDGGSTDKTREIITKYAKKYKKIKSVFKNCKNVSVARNVAIKEAKGNIIACTDGGCIADKDWLKNLVTVFPEADVAGGFAKPQQNTIFKKILGSILFSRKKAIGQFSPSSRSLAFKKLVWEKVGGYPEELYTAEDTVFNSKLVENGFKIVPVKNAVVYWDMRDNLFLLFRQYRRYGIGDGEIKLPLKIFGKGRTTHAISSCVIILGGYLFIASLIVSLLFHKILLFWILMFLLIFYLFSGILKALSVSKSLKAIYYVPLIHLARRIGYFIGFHQGLFGRKIKKQ